MVEHQLVHCPHCQSSIMRDNFCSHCGKILPLAKIELTNEINERFPFEESFRGVELICPRFTNSPLQNFEAEGVLAHHFIACIRHRRWEALLVSWLYPNQVEEYVRQYGPGAERSFDGFAQLVKCGFVHLIIHEEKVFAALTEKAVRYIISVIRPPATEAVA